MWPRRQAPNTPAPAIFPWILLAWRPAPPPYLPLHKKRIGPSPSPFPRPLPHLGREPQLHPLPYAPPHVAAEGGTASKQGLGTARAQVIHCTYRDCMCKDLPACRASGHGPCAMAGMLLAWGPTTAGKDQSRNSETAPIYALLANVGALAIGPDGSPGSAPPRAATCLSPCGSPADLRNSSMLQTPHTACPWPHRQQQHTRQARAVRLQHSRLQALQVEDCHALAVVVRVHRHVHLDNLGGVVWGMRHEDSGRSYAGPHGRGHTRSVAGVHGHGHGHDDRRKTCHTPERMADGCGHQSAGTHAPSPLPLHTTK